MVLEASFEKTPETLYERSAVALSVFVPVAKASCFSFFLI